MVRYKSGGMFANFGSGTVRVKQSPFKTKFGGMIELTNCEKTKVGQEPVDTILNGPNILLGFTSVESLDVVIAKLQELREELETHVLKV